MKRYAIQIRMPLPLKQWVAQQAKANCSSQNSEVVRAVRERMEREGVFDSIGNGLEE